MGKGDTDDEEETRKKLHGDRAGGRERDREYRVNRQVWD